VSPFVGCHCENRHKRESHLQRVDVKPPAVQGLFCTVVAFAYL
jgi:hypothetical protein